MSPTFFKAIVLKLRGGGKTAPIPRRFSSLPSYDFGLVSRPKVVAADIFNDCQRGFTLLEMVLVLFIMGLMASLSLMFIDNEDNQLRYQETLQKLDALQAASINVVQYNNDFIFSGFIADNGVLPTSVDQFLELPTDWVMPQLFDNDATTNTVLPAKYRLNTIESHENIDDSGNTQYRLIKGYRGAYISSRKDSSGDYKFKTGWGQDFTVQTVSNNLQFSYDETLINDDEYDLSNLQEVPADHWSIALSEIALNGQVINNSGNPINSTDYKIAISVFRNTETNDADERWITYHVDIPAMSDGESINFPLTGWDDESGNEASSMRIPAGEHPVFIVKPGTPNVVNSLIITKVIPGYSPQPAIELVITP